GIEDIGIAGRRDDVFAVAAHHRAPLRRAGAAARGAAPAAVVLQADADVVRGVVIHVDRVALFQGEVGGMNPMLAAVLGEVDASVVALDHAIRVLRVHPERMVVAVERGARGRNGLAAVGGVGHAHREEEDLVGVVGHDLEAAEVEGAAVELVIVAGHGPGIAGVVGAPEDAALGLNLGIQPLGLAGREFDRNAPVGAGGQAAREFVPSGAVIGGFVDAAAGAAVLQAPGMA